MEKVKNANDLFDIKMEFAIPAESLQFKEIDDKFFKGKSIAYYAFEANAQELNEMRAAIKELKGNPMFSKESYKDLVDKPDYKMLYHEALGKLDLIRSVLDGLCGLKDL